MNFRSVLLAAAILLLPAVSAAQDKSGLYASLTGAWVVPTDSTLSAMASGHKFSAKLEFDNGFGVLAAIGRRFGTGFRAEVELGYREFDFDSLTGAQIIGPYLNEAFGPLSADSGDVGTLSLMANAIYEFDVGQVHPYLGAGVGVAQHDIPIGDDWIFARQVMAGIAYPVSVKTDIRVGYRYLATSEADFIGLKATYGTQNLEAGIL